MNLSNNSEPHIVVIDRNCLFRNKLIFLLQKEAKMPYEKISTFSTICEAHACIAGNFDLLLLEDSLLNEPQQLASFMSFISSSSHVKIVFFTENSSEAMIPKDMIAKDLINPTFDWKVSSKTIDKTTFLQLIDKISGRNMAVNVDDRLSLLTPRENEILNCLVLGQSNKEIARALVISESTVKVHVQNILKKFDVTSRVEAAVYAVRYQLA